MNILIIFDSYFGNTKEAAVILSNKLRKYNTVEIAHVNNKKILNSLKAYEIIVIGSPTRYGRATKAIEKILKSKLPNKCIYYLFDTRMGKNFYFRTIIDKLFIPKGYALDRMKGFLLRRGYYVADTFYFKVEDTDGPLSYNNKQLDQWINKINSRYHKQNIILEDISLHHYNQLISIDNSESDYNKLLEPNRDLMSRLEYKVRNTKLKNALLNGRPTKWIFRKLIINKSDNRIIGYTHYYWKSRKNNWLEIGIVIFNKNDWGKGIGYKSLKLWIKTIFASNIDIVRVGLSTWSGNRRMVNLAKKLNFIEEGRIREAIESNGEYYDLITYGMLKKEWLETITS